MLYQNGYCGDLVDGRRQGSGIMTYPTGERYGVLLSLHSDAVPPHSQVWGFTTAHPLLCARLTSSFNANEDMRANGIMTRGLERGP